MKSNGVDINSFTDYVSNTIEKLNSRDVDNSMARRISLEEVRDAMINECQNGYCCFLDEACEIAVKIAYHFKAFQRSQSSGIQSSK